MRRFFRPASGFALAGIAAMMAFGAIQSATDRFDFPGFYAAIAAMTGIGAIFLLRSPKV